MPLEVVTILVLVGVFLVATLLPVNMGALAFVATFVVGGWVVGEEVPDEVLAGFPADLFIILVGVTYLFAFAKRHGINPVLMSLLIINGASAGGFSPISIFGAITNGVVGRSGLPGSPLGLFLASYVFNTLLSVGVFFMFGGRQLIHRRAGPEFGGHEGGEPDEEDFDETVLREERERESPHAGPVPSSSAVSSGLGTGQPGTVSRTRRRTPPAEVEERLDMNAR